MSSVTARVRLTATDAAIAQAKEVSDILRTPGGALSVQHQDDRVAMPRELQQLIQKVIEVMAGGGTVTVSALPEELTTTNAAAILGISRPTLMKMIREGEILSHKVGSHHRLSTADVYEALSARRARERAAYEELLKIDARSSSS